MKPGSLWPIALAGVLGLTVVANGVLVYQATRAGPAATEPDYYQRALDWDSTMAQARVNLELGWRVSGRLTGDGRVELAVSDRDGAPIALARIDGEGFALAGGDAYRLSLAPIGDGNYEGRLGDRRAGLHEIRLTIRTDDHRVTAVLRGSPGSALVPRA
ncbi:MAG: FixH family protein [Gemmatimonadales bacterium]